jgi:hypothetical protein
MLPQTALVKPLEDIINRSGFGEIGVDLVEKPHDLLKLINADRKLFTVFGNLYCVLLSPLHLFCVLFADTGPGFASAWLLIDIRLRSCLIRADFAYLCADFADMFALLC